MIHHAVHEARPDVMCAAHSHSIYGRTFCSLGRKLDTITQDSCAFHNDLALYESFNGVVLAEEEGKDIAKALGGQKAALLTVGKTIEEAVFWFVSLEKCCHSQLMADAAVAGRGGATVKIGEEEAMYTRKTVGSTMAGTCAVLCKTLDITLTTSRLLLSEATLRCHPQGNWWRLLGVSARAE
jgi:ribulose-5-phosphate 4-epimerase/fuculose-1-phosphate aldolase